MQQRKKSIVFLFLFLAIGLLGLFVTIFHNYKFMSVFLQKVAPDRDSIMQIEDYWAETKLQPNILLSIVQNEKCQISERYFLACANAVTKMQQRQMQKDFSYEKKSLLEWKKNYLLKSSYDFEQAIKNILQKSSTQNQTYLVASGVNGFLSILKDPHTYILPLKYFNEVVAQSNQNLSLGFNLSEGPQGIFVKKVFQKSSADQAGIKKGDVLISIDDKNISQLNLTEISSIFRQKIKNDFVLLMRRQSTYKRIYLIRSKKSQIDSIHLALLEKNKNIAVLTIDKFAKNTCEQVKDIILKNKRGLGGLILDLRDNPGGQMDEASCIAGLFLNPKELVFELKYLDSKKENEKYLNKASAKVYSGPLAVLVNKDSASAAELVAGALQDYQRAIILGQKTFGKGSFQEGEVWSQNSRIVLFETKGFYYLPSGETPQLNGITPNIQLAATEDYGLREKDQFTFPLEPLPSQIRFDYIARAFKNPPWSNCVGRYEKNVATLESVTESTDYAGNILSCMGQKFVGSQSGISQF
ncbi:MAG: S41 family peptidase [Pseudobdellovibrionaceae bacterium]